MYHYHIQQNFLGGKFSWFFVSTAMFSHKSMAGSIGNIHKYTSMLPQTFSHEQPFSSLTAKVSPSNVLPYMVCGYGSVIQMFGQL